MPPMMILGRPVVRLPAALFMALIATTACGDEPATSADLEFTDMWTRQPAAGQSVGAVYGTVINTGATDVTITGASVDVTDRAELHEVVEVDGLMTMRERDGGYVVPALGSFVFEPGGPHVMLFGIDPATYPTDALDVTFTFDAGDATFATAEVRALDGTNSDMHSDMDMDGDMNHSSHGDADMDGDTDAQGDS